MARTQAAGADTPPARRQHAGRKAGEYHACPYCRTRDLTKFRRYCGDSPAAACLACEGKIRRGDMAFENDPYFASLGAVHHPASCTCKPCRLWKQVQALNAKLGR